MLIESRQGDPEPGLPGYPEPIDLSFDSFIENGHLTQAIVWSLSHGVA